MYQLLIEKIGQVLSGINPLFLFSFVISVGLYVFWKGCIESRKNNSSIFDIFTISSTLGLVTGRIGYIISNWSDFSSYIWYWLPYERYGEEMFLFRVLPWRFFRVWDWGIDILLMFVGFLAVATIAVVFVKKWKWSHLFPTLFFTAQIMLAISFFLLGASTDNNAWVIQGTVMILLPLTLYFLANSVKKIMIGKKERKVLVILDIFFIALTMIYIAHSYLSTEINPVERSGIYFFSIWTVLGIIFFIMDSKKGKVTIEKVSSVRIVSSIDINQPIKLSK